MAGDKKLPSKSSASDVDTFLRKVAAAPVVRPAGERGRLIFAMDATASREPLWDRACHIQAQMFEATASMGGIEIQLAYYRGFGEFKAAPWAAEADVLQKRMTSIRCAAGQTQIRRLLKHALEQARSKQGAVSALVFVGDCMEEDPDSLAQLAGELGISQSAVSQLEHAEDMKVSTLRHYVEQLGARLVMLAVFDEGGDDEQGVPIRLGGRPA